MTISFNVSADEHGAIHQIVERAEVLAAKHGGSVDRLSLSMDLTACHANGCPLKLDELLEANDGDFAHDVFGIRREINGDTGHMACFLPRYAR